VYHAEVVADRTGEPFGTIILAVAVTKSAKPPLDC
jgi:Ca2+/H+ antiporter